MRHHFNQLTPAQAERLAMLAEEAAETIQIVGKILRHGLDSYHPDRPELGSNLDMLNRELTDFAAVVASMQSDGVSLGLENRDAAWRRKLAFTHHQEIDP